MLFSIIVPVYKTEEYVGACIESVLEQTVSDWELILVDDGSPDRCGEICDAYAAKDPRIRVLHKENGGVTAARGAGLALASGEYVLFLDSDDYFAKDLLASVAKVACEYAPQIVAFACTRCFKDRTAVMKNQYEAGFYNAQRLESVKRYLIYDKRLPALNLGGVIYGLSVKAVRREHLLRYWDRVPDGIKRGEDMAMTVLLIERCSSLYFLDHAGYYYRDNPASVTNTFYPNDTEDARLLIECLDRNLGEEYKNNIDVYCLYRCANHLIAAAKQFATYQEYKKYVKSTYEAVLHHRIRSAKVYRPSMKDRVKIFVMKHRMYLFIYKFLGK